MHNFSYVSSKQLSPIKKDLISIMNAVQNLVRHDFTFQFEFVGSTERQMVTQDIGNNTIGFHICNLREKLFAASPDAPFMIRCERNVGYCFELIPE